MTFYVDTCSVLSILFNFYSMHYMFNFTYNITFYCHTIKKTYFIDTYVVNSNIFKDVKISHLITYVKTFRKNLLPPFRDVRKWFFFPSSFPTKMFYFYIFVKSHLSLITQTIFGESSVLWKCVLSIFCALTPLPFVPKYFLQQPVL